MDFIDGSLLQNSFILGLCLLILVSFVAGFIDSVAGGAGLVLVPSFILACPPTANRPRTRKISQHNRHSKRDF